MTYHKISCELLREISFSPDQLTVVDSDWTPRDRVIPSFALESTQ